MRVLVCVVVTAVAAGMLSLAGTTTAPAASSPIAGRFWLRDHSFFDAHRHHLARPDDRRPLNVYDLARTLLGEGDVRRMHQVEGDVPHFREALLLYACTYIFGPTSRLQHVLHVRHYRFHGLTSGPNSSPRAPGGTDHAGYALQCSFSTDARGSRLLDLQVSSGGLALRNLTTYAHERRNGVTAELTYSVRPGRLVSRARVRAYLHRRLSRVEYDDS